MIRAAGELVSKLEDEVAGKLEGSNIGKWETIPDSEGLQDTDTSDSISMAETLL